MMTVDQVRDHSTMEERQACVRALLQTPLLHAGGRQGDVFRLVRRHAQWLRSWFAAEPAWPFVVESEYARLVKIPARVDDATHPALDVKQGLPFSKRRYVLLCLVLAVLEKSERQTALGRLAKDVMMAAHGDEAFTRTGIDVRFERRAERLDLVAVIRRLTEWGVLTRVHGDEEGYIQQSGDVLYTIHRSVMARIPAMQRGPSTLPDAAAAERPWRLHPAEQIVTGEAARRRRLRTTVTRLLLDHPVVYYADLSEEELTYLNSQRARLVHEIEDAVGLVAEVRAEGIAMVDPQRKLTDHAMPDEGTNGHAALLLAEFLVERAGRDAHAGVPVLRLEQYMGEQAARHKERWRNDVREPSGLRQLLRDVLERLHSLQLVRWTDDRVVPLPALGRYRLDPAGAHTQG